MHGVGECPPILKIDPEWCKLGIFLMKIISSKFWYKLQQTNALNSFIKKKIKWNNYVRAGGRLSPMHKWCRHPHYRGVSQIFLLFYLYGIKSKIQTLFLKLDLLKFQPCSAWEFEFRLQYWSFQPKINFEKFYIW